MMIAKAYESLTDPAAKENWEKYGNPDGRQSMEVSIGLPTFLLDAEWKHTILLVYLFIMVVCIPAAVWLYYSNSSKYGERGVMYKSWGWFNHAINETLTYKSCPEVLSGCAEFHERLNPSTTNPNNGGEMAEMKRLQKAVGQFMNRPKYNHVLVVKGNLLMHAHLTRTAIENKAMQQDVEFMLSNCTTLLDAMIDHSHQRGWLEPAREIIVFTQHLTQAVWGKDCELMQLPYFGKAEIKHVTMGKVKTLKEYIKQDDDAKKGLAGLTAPQKADVLAVCALIPDMKVAVKTFVEDDEDSKIYQNDLITVRVDMDRLNLEEGEEVSPTKLSEHTHAERAHTRRASSRTHAHHTLCVALFLTHVYALRLVWFTRRTSRSRSWRRGGSFSRPRTVKLLTLPKSRTRRRRSSTTSSSWRHPWARTTWRCTS